MMNIKYPLRKSVIVMTILVRNEQDIIAENILFHHRQGVDQFIVMDNLSSDSTASIVKELSISIPIELLEQSQDNYDQSAWVTSMAHRAFLKYNADWVINNDADEFWMFPNFDAHSYFENVPNDVDGILIDRHNAVLGQDSFHGFDAHPCWSTLFEKRSFNQLGNPLPGKCLHRASDLITVGQGNHSITGHKGRIISCKNTKILHFPYRSFSHYQSKIRFGGAAYLRNSKLSKDIGRTWREQYEVVDQPELINFWSSLRLSRQQVIRAEARGDFIRESSLQIELSKLNESWKRTQFKFSSLDLIESTAAQVREYVGRCESRVGDLDWREPRSLHYNNLPFLANGPLRHQCLLDAWVQNFNHINPCNHFTDLRDIISLFPGNSSLIDWTGLALTLNEPHQSRRLNDYCQGKNVVVFMSCVRYLDRSIKSAMSFKERGYCVLIVAGTDCDYPNKLSFDFDGDILRLPVPDDYEHLATKVFYAYLVLYFIGKPKSVTKVDDDITLSDPDRFYDLLSTFDAKNLDYFGKLINVGHREQCHGWHLDKCAEPSFHRRGYQFPFPDVYASGGFGYCISPRMLRACTVSYLSMQSFFEMNCVQLEDVFVGLAAQADGISAASFEDSSYVDKGLGLYPDVANAVLPGLRRKTDVH